MCDSKHRHSKCREQSPSSPSLLTLTQAAPECRYFVGEHSASGFLPWDYGGLDREQNGSYNRPQPYEVRAMHIDAASYQLRTNYLLLAAYY